MDTKAIGKDQKFTLIAIGDHVVKLNPELVKELEELEDHEESFDPRNRNGIYA